MGQGTRFVRPQGHKCRLEPTPRRGLRLVRPLRGRTPPRRTPRRDLRLARRHGRGLHTLDPPGSSGSRVKKEAHGWDPRRHDHPRGVTLTPRRTRARLDMTCINHGPRHGAQHYPTMQTGRHCSANSRYGFSQQVPSNMSLVRGMGSHDRRQGLTHDNNDIQDGGMAPLSSSSTAPTGSASPA
jgi:hypothetical protein